MRICSRATQAIDSSVYNVAQSVGWMKYLEASANFHNYSHNDFLECSPNYRQLTNQKYIESTRLVENSVRLYNNYIYPLPFYFYLIVVTNPINPSLPAKI